MNSTISSIETIERYLENQEKIQPLIESIIEIITDPEILIDAERQKDMLKKMAKPYPYIDMVYSLSDTGQQLLDTTLSVKRHRQLKHSSDKNTDRSQRPYFVKAVESETSIVTKPYLSITDGTLIISVAKKVFNTDKTLAGYLVCDFDLTSLVNHFMGDARRNKFVPFFNIVYTVIAVGLLLVMSMLLFAAFKEISYFLTDFDQSSLRPFSAIIFFTLALSIFDLAKTVLEEEVFMHKDIFRHSSTRRTITRFISAILIAVSIEALLLMFKSTLGDGKNLVEAVWMMLAAVGLLTGLGFYVYMGAKAESLLIRSKKDERSI